MSMPRHILLKAAVVATMGTLALLSNTATADAAVQCGMICVDECPVFLPDICSPCLRSTVCYGAPFGVCGGERFVLDCDWDQ